MFGKGDSELNNCEFDVEGRNNFHLRVDQVLASLDDVQPGVNPDDSGCAPQSKCSPESSGYALGAVMMKDLQVNCTAGEAEHYEDPSLELNTTLRGQNGSEDVRFTE